MSEYLVVCTGGPLMITALAALAMGQGPSDDEDPHSRLRALLERLDKRPQFTTISERAALVARFEAAEGPARLPAALAVAQFENLYMSRPEGPRYIEALHAMAERAHAEAYLLIAQAYRALRLGGALDAKVRARAKAARHAESPYLAASGLAVLALGSYVEGEFGAAIYQANRARSRLAGQSTPLATRVRRMSLELLRVSYGYIADASGLAKVLDELLELGATDIVPPVELTYLGSIANLGHRLGDVELVLAAHAVARARPVQPEAGVVAYFVDALTESRRFEEVLEYAKVASNGREPFRTMISSRVAEAYAETGQLEAAEELARSLNEGSSPQASQPLVRLRIQSARAAILRARGDANGAVTLYRSIAQLVERRSREVIARDQGRLQIAVEGRLEESRRRLEQERKTSALEAALVRRQRTQLWILAVSFVLLAGVSLALAISHRRVGRARDVAASANLAKSQFLATMSHEIRTPMNGVLGFADILADTELTERQREYLGYIQGSCQLLLELINDVLDLSKMEAGALELESVPVQPEALVADVMDSLSSRAGPKGVRLALNCASDVPATVLSDPTRLRQVLLNLIGNAIKFTKDGGAVAARIAWAQLDTSERVLTIEIEDTGIGIPSDRLNTLFQPFRQVDASTTRKYGGTGLGLSIAKNIVEATGGHLLVASTEGVGTTFSAVLIVRPDPEAETRRKPLEGRRVALIDENPLSLRTSRDELETGGAQVEAYESWSRFELEPGEGPDFVISDRAVHPTHRHGRWLLLACNPAEAVPAEFDGVIMRPLTSAKLQPSTRSSASPFANQRIKLRVLVAEDNPTNQALMRHILGKIEGCEFKLVNDGAQALAAARDETFDLILMDVHMPNLDGVEATRRIRALPHGATLPIVALTANTSDEDVRNYLAAGMNDHLSKPLNRSRLQEILVAASREPHSSS